MTERSGVELETLPQVQIDPTKVVVCEPDPLIAEQLVLQLRSFGYTAQPITTLTELPRVLSLNQRHAQPLAIVSNMEQADGTMVTAAHLTDIGAALYPLPPVIFSGRQMSLQSRLHAIRAGGHGYVPNPIDVADLVDLLDDLIARLADEPYRVLVVEDSPMLADYFSATLARAGMQVRSTTDPYEVLSLIAEFQPELLLIDLYMPEVSGPELATVIRQQPAHVGMPIVFLSGETDRSAQLAAMRGGGDDFLTKPIMPEHLVAALTTRMDRARALRHQLNHDGLTGLLNHSTMAERLKTEIGRAFRCGTPLSVAMVDLDRFKQVNDTYGHVAGDRVLKNLARLLQQRLRRTDHIGRYGGEEFMLILVGADGEAGARVLDELRERFAQITHQYDGVSWNAQFSAGVAAFPEYNDVGGLVKAADAALYAAKRAGRNKVVLA
jgi:diguanylate cyclase (GGDEF)-like protein